MRRPDARREAGRAALLGVAVVLLAGIVLWLLSERNARQWFLVQEDGALVVKKGILLPAGRQVFKTADPLLAQAYAPVKPPPGAKLDEERAFDDRASLDQALYDLFARWARDDIASQRPEQVERALGWLARAERLAGISASQRDDLKALRAESGYFEARQLLEKSADALRQARERLRLTASSSSPRAGDASEALRHVEPVVEEVYRAIRQLGPGAAPRAADAAPEPAGGVPAPAPAPAPSAAPRP